MAAERKPVTVLFCDLAGSTALGEHLDPELLQTIQAAYFDRVRAVVERFGGTVEKFIGDAVCAVFGVPRVHEDDAERAVRCAFAVRDALAELSDELRPRLGVELTVRIGVEAGEVVVGGEALATGDVMSTTARLEQAAQPGEILVGGSARLLTRRAVVYEGPRLIEAKGKAEGVEAWLAVTIEPEPRWRQARLIGRERELATLAGAFERAVHDTQPEVVVVLGEPGIGKSRLAEEFASRVARRAVVLRGACFPYRHASALLPLAQVVRSEFGGSPEKLAAGIRRRHEGHEGALLQAQLSALTGASGTMPSATELVWGLRRYLEALASERPAVVVLDDRSAFTTRSSGRSPTSPCLSGIASSCTGRRRPGSSGGSTSGLSSP
jgi:class 3 adenylate cyclase